MEKSNKKDQGQHDALRHLAVPAPPLVLQRFVLF